MTDTGAVDSRFLYALFRSPDYRRHVLNTATQTTVRDTAPSRLHDYRFKLPSLAEQRWIGETIGAFDDKIESNRRLAAALDEAAETLFQRWFAQQGGSAAIPLRECVGLVLGGTPSRRSPEFWTDGTVPWIASGKANEFRILTPTEWITEEAVARSATKLLPAGTTVVAITGATMGQVSRLEIDACANQSIIGLLGNDAYPDAVLFYWLKESIDELLTRQTGAAQQHVNKNDVGALPIPRFDPVATRGVDAALSPLLAMVRSLLVEAGTLAQIRDELLPRLISGEQPMPDDVEDLAA